MLYHGPVKTVCESCFGEYDVEFSEDAACYLCWTCRNVFRGGYLEPYDTYLSDDY